MAEATAENHRTKQRWVIIMFFFLSGLLTASWTSRIPEVQAKLQLNNAQLGTVLFAIPAGLLTGMSVAGWLVTTFGTQRILLFGGLLCSLLLFCTSLAPASLSLMVVLFLMGFARTVFNLAANTSAVELQQQYKKPIISTFHGMWSLACFIAAGISTVMIIYAVSLPVHYAGIAILVGVACILLMGKKNDHVRVKEPKPFFVKPDKYLFFLGLMTLCAMLCEGATFDWSVNYFAKVVGAKKSYVTLGYLSFIITMALGRLAGDRLIGAFGPYRMLMVNGLLMATGFSIAALFPYVVTAALGFMLVGMGSSILVPVLYMLAATSKKMSPAYALASVTTIGSTGFLIGPLFIGNVSQYFGMPAALLALSSTSLLLVYLATRVRLVAQVQ